MAAPLARQPVDQVDCGFFDDQMTTVRTLAAAQLANQTRAARATTTRRPRRRKVWDLIVFGHELPMLRLHMRTLQGVVAGFLVTESTTCFQQAKTKPA
eukprot:3071032-Prymnesium_polylepis.1